MSKWTKMRGRINPASLKLLAEAHKEALEKFETVEVRLKGVWKLCIPPAEELEVFVHMAGTTLVVNKETGEFVALDLLTELRRRDVQTSLSLLRGKASGTTHGALGQEARPKETSAVAEATSCTSDEVHGGDSASGEVPEGSSGGGLGPPEPAGGNVGAGTGPSPSLDGEGDRPPAGQPPPAGAGSSGSTPGEEGARDTSPPERAASSPPERRTPSEDRASEGEGTEGLSPDEFLKELTGELPGEVSGRQSSLGGAPEDFALRGARSLPQEEAPERISKEFKEVRSILRLASGGGAGGVSLHERKAYGGVYASIKGKRPDQKLVRRARRAFARMVHGGEGAPGPRWEGRKIATKTAAFLRAWDAGDRKPEDGRPAILVLPDVSGSMSAFAGEVVKLAVAVGRLGVPGSDVVVVVHSNGYPEELVVNGRLLEELDCYFSSFEEIFEIYQSLLARFEVKAAILAADWDGEWVYRWLADQGIDLFWLDPWSCSKLPVTVVPFPPKHAQSFVQGRWTERQTKRVRYAFGCATAEEGVRALEKMIV